MYLRLLSFEVATLVAVSQLNRIWENLRICKGNKERYAACWTLVLKLGQL